MFLRDISSENSEEVSEESYEESYEEYIEENSDESINSVSSATSNFDEDMFDYDQLDEAQQHEDSSLQLLCQIALTQDVTQLKKFLTENSKNLISLLDREDNPIHFLLSQEKYVEAQFLIQQFNFLKNEFDLDDHISVLERTYMKLIAEQIANNDKRLVEIKILFTMNYWNPEVFFKALAKNTFLKRLHIHIKNKTVFPNSLTLKQFEEMTKGLNSNQTLREIHFSHKDALKFVYRFSYQKLSFINMLKHSANLFSIDIPPSNTAEPAIYLTMTNAIRFYTERNQLNAILHLFDVMQFLVLGSRDEKSILSILPLDLMRELFLQTMAVLEISSQYLANNKNNLYTLKRNQISFWSRDVKPNEIYIREQIYNKFLIKVFDLKYEEEFGLMFTCHRNEPFEIYLKSLRTTFFELDETKNKESYTIQIKSELDIKSFLQKINFKDYQVEGLMRYFKGKSVSYLKHKCV